MQRHTYISCLVFILELQDIKFHLKIQRKFVVIISHYMQRVRLSFKRQSSDETAVHLSLELQRLRFKLL